MAVVVPSVNAFTQVPATLMAGVTEMLKPLEAEIKALQAKIASLESQNAAANAKIARLESQHKAHEINCVSHANNASLSAARNVETQLRKEVAALSAKITEVDGKVEEVISAYADGVQQL